MQCPSCEDPNQQGVNTICSNCNQAFNQCPDCNYQNPLIAQICSDCGNTLAQAQTTTAPRDYRRGFSIAFVILGSIFLALIFLVPVIFSWNFYCEIVLLILSALSLHLWRSFRNKFNAGQIFGWRMWYIYAMIAGLLLVLAIIRQGG